MKGKVCLVTGANAGIGKYTTMALAQAGAQVVMLCRNKSKAQAALREIQTLTGSKTIEVMYADLSNQEQIRTFADKFKARYAKLDVLINNAGVFMRRREITMENYEMTFAVNHLAYFLLTDLLLDSLKAADNARIINVSSEAHRNAKLDFEDLMNFKHYNPIRAYSQSKLANIYFTYELARRLKGTGITTNCLHPGMVATEFARDVPIVFRLLFNLFGVNAQKGSQTSIYLAMAPEVEGVTGKYFVKSKATRSSTISYDEALARQLWERSEMLTRR